MAKKKRRARAKKPIPEPYRSQGEVEYAKRLDAERAAGRISEWRYEPMRLLLARPKGGKGQWTYTPDFLVVNNDGTMDFHEVKGKVERSDEQRLKAAAETYPWYGWLMVRKRGRSWEETWFSD